MKDRLDGGELGLMARHQLREPVMELAEALRQLGVGPGHENTEIDELQP